MPFARILPALLVVAALLCAAQASALPVRVRGGAVLRAQAQFVAQGGVLELRGRLSDDGLSPLEGGWIDLATSGDLPVADAGGCPAPQVRIAPLAGGLRVQTTAGGEICLRWRQAPRRGAIRLHFNGDSYHGSAQLEVQFDRARPQLLATTLRFEPRPLTLDLDKKRMTISAILDLDLATAAASRGGLEILLYDERDQRLANSKTGGDGKARLTVNTQQLAGPGGGKLRLHFAGTDQLAAASDQQPITRRATVSLTLDDTVEPADPGDAVELTVLAAATRGVVETGVVEGTLNGSSVGSAPVEQGRANLVVTLDPALTPGEAELSLRYLPASPWYQAGSPLIVAIPIAPPSMLLRVLLTVVVLGAAIWVTVSWRRSKKPPDLGLGTPMLTPGVHVVQSRRGAKSWKGTVVDAHDGHPLGGVSIIIRQPSLQGDGVLLETTTDRHGSFAVDLPQRPEGAEIIARSTSHSEERKALPPGGILRIALITRRRAVLRRFVHWARRRGAPFDKRPDPTPAHVRSAAKKQPAIQSWAATIEAAVFGPDEVDETVETTLRDDEP